MVLLVPYDDTPLARTALKRAAQFSKAVDESVVVMTVIPRSTAYARDHGWLNDDEPFDQERIQRRLKTQINAIAPTATLRIEQPGPGDERASVTTDIVRTIRTVATELNPTIVFLGSENAGQVTSPITSVGSPVSGDHRYDIHIVRQPAEEFDN